MSAVAPASALADPRPVAQLTSGVTGSIRVPGSKSITNRALMLAALSGVPVTLRSPLRADDTEAFAAAIRAMGGIAAPLLGPDWLIDGAGLRRPRAEVAVNLGDGGTPTRFLLALALLCGGPTIVDGSARMRERPVADGVALLRQLGARIESAGGSPGAGHNPATEGAAGEVHLPLRVMPLAAPKQPLRVTVGPVASSQFISAVLLLAPALPAGAEIDLPEAPTSESYLHLTLGSLKTFGVHFDSEAIVVGAAARRRIRVHPGLRAPAIVDIAPDASSAVYWVAAAAGVPGSRLLIAGLERDSQPDVGAIDAIGQMGAALSWRPDGLLVESRPLRGIDADASAWPDGALAVAAIAAAAGGRTRLTGLSTLAVKESDRLTALATELTRVGAVAKADRNSITIDPAATMGAPIQIDTYRDHRIAMSFAILGLLRGGLAIRDPGCVAKSYPEFWRDLESISRAQSASVAPQAR